jgi:hypothetical protein
MTKLVGDSIVILVEFQKYTYSWENQESNKDKLVHLEKWLLLLFGMEVA